MAAKSLISQAAVQPIYGTPATPGCLTNFKADLDSCSQLIDCWPRRSATDGQETIQRFLDHQGWYGEIKERVCKRAWNPNVLRVWCWDPVIAARTAAWLRKSQLSKAGKPATTWNTGEFIRLVDPVFDSAGNLLLEPDQDCRISLVRPIQYGDSKGIVRWTTPKRGDPRSLDISIPPMPLLAVKLQPLAASEKPIAVLTEAPGSNAWRETCKQFREDLAGARHDFGAYETGLQWSGELQRQVVRLRSATALPAECFHGQSSTAVALHHDMTAVFGEQDCDLVKAIVAGSIAELIFFQNPPR